MNTHSLQEIKDIIIDADMNLSILETQLLTYDAVLSANYPSAASKLAAARAAVDTALSELDQAYQLLR